MHLSQQNFTFSWQLLKNGYFQVAKYQSEPQLKG